MPTPRDPAVGDVFDQKYRLTSLLGEGGMGKVFAAEHQWMGNEVAVKILSAEAMSFAGTFQRLQQEAMAASKMEHPNITKVLDFGVDRDTTLPYIVMERLVGMTLEDYLADSPGGRIGKNEALTLLLPIMDALVAAHRVGVVHRDIKPGNIFLALELDGSFTPKVIDFGIAKALTPLLKEALRTGTGQAIGTPSYMAREQAAGQSDIDGRVDVWAIGVLLYEMLSGQLPYVGGNSNVIMAKILYEDPVALETVFPEVDPDLARVVGVALCPSRDDRYRSMQAFLSALLDVSGPKARASLRATGRGSATAVGSELGLFDEAPELVSHPVALEQPPLAKPSEAERSPEPEDASSLRPPVHRWPWWVLAMVLCGAGVVILFAATR